MKADTTALHIANLQATTGPWNVNSACIYSAAPEAGRGVASAVVDILTNQTNATRGQKEPPSNGLKPQQSVHLHRRHRYRHRPPFAMVVAAERWPRDVTCLHQIVLVVKLCPVWEIPFPPQRPSTYPTTSLVVEGRHSAWTTNATVPRHGKDSKQHKRLTLRGNPQIANFPIHNREAEGSNGKSRQLCRQQPKDCASCATPEAPPWQGSSGAVNQSSKQSTQKPGMWGPQTAIPLCYPQPWLLSGLCTHSVHHSAPAPPYRCTPVAILKKAATWLTCSGTRRLLLGGTSAGSPCQALFKGP